MRNTLFSSILIAVFLSLHLLSFVFVNPSNNLNKDETNLTGEVLPAAAEFIHPDKFFERDSFITQVANTKEYTSNQNIIGGIIPHHLLAGHFISDMFSRLKPQNPATIILIGPNHYEKGDFPILISDCDWETKFGNVESEKKIVKSLIEKNIAEIDRDVLTHEHSVAGMMSYIKYYLPDSKVVPIIISAYTSKSELEKLHKYLSGIVSTDVVVIAPVDMSHYLSNEEANLNDAVTMEILKNREYERLSRLDNDYTDSPKTLEILLKTVESSTGNVLMESVGHSNSAEILNTKHIQTTSYFEILFVREQSSISDLFAL